MSSKDSYNSNKDHWNNRGGYRQDFSRRGNGSYRNSQQRNFDSRQSLSNDEYNLINQGKADLFNKKKNFPIITRLEDKSLLLSKNLFKADRWEIKELIGLKEKLNNTRNLLNEKDIKVWKQHTSKTNMTGNVVKYIRDPNGIEMCTNAWIKMAEIFSKYENLIPKDLHEDQPFRTIHVCEAPGAFICATNFYYNLCYEKRSSRSMRPQWQWMGLSLNPYYEGNDQEAMVDDDRFIIETLDRWYFGIDNSGNILDINNIKGLWERVRADPKSTGVHLVTGDGSVDTSGDPNEQESIVSELHYAEAICALGALTKGGSLVLKMFNLFECETICLLYILSLHFKELSIFKPASSRAPNGETYIIAIGFRGIEAEILNSLLSFVSPTFPHGKALISLDSIPKQFLDELIKISEYFTMKQIQALERNLELEKIWNRNIQEAIFQLNVDVVREFRRQCSISFNYIQPVRIVTNVQLDGSAKSLGNSAAVIKGGLRQRAGGTLEDRQTRKRVREEFLLDQNTNNDEDDNEQTIEDSTMKRHNLGQGKTVAIGKNIPKNNKSNEIPSDLSLNQPEQTPNNSWAMKLLKKQGFKEGEGLGAHGQGRSTPIPIEINNTRLGLGHHFKDLKPSSSTSSLKMPSVMDEPLFSSYDHSISSDSLYPIDKISMKTIGTNLRSVLSSLFVKFDDLELLYKKREEYYQNIKDENLIERKIFISDQLEILNNGENNRDLHGFYTEYQTGFQLASLDKIFHLTKMNLDNSTPLSFIIDNKSLIGFAQYLSWQQNDFVHGLIVSASMNSIQVNSNISIKSQIDTNYPKVHLFFSDSSILPNDIKINQRYLEVYNKRQFIISCRNALTKLNENGHFICKIADTLTRFTSGIIYLLYRSFKSISIIRPFTLDPSNSARFLICQGLKYPINQLFIEHIDYLLKNENIDFILEVVPLKCLLEPQFQQYMADTSKRLLQREIQSLGKRLWFIQHENDFQSDCLIKEEDWNEAHELVTVQRRPKFTPVEPDSGITLPIGWTKHWSKREETFYYFNTNNGESRWERPI